MTHSGEVFSVVVGGEEKRERVKRGDEQGKRDGGWLEIWRCVSSCLWPKDLTLLTSIIPHSTEANNLS